MSRKQVFTCNVPITPEAILDNCRKIICTTVNKHLLTFTFRSIENHVTKYTHNNATMLIDVTVFLYTLSVCRERQVEQHKARGFHFLSAACLICK